MCTNIRVHMNGSEMANCGRVLICITRAIIPCAWWLFVVVCGCYSIRALSLTRILFFGRNIGVFAWAPCVCNNINRYMRGWANMPMSNEQSFFRYKYNTMMCSSKIIKIQIPHQSKIGVFFSDFCRFNSQYVQPILCVARN